MQKKRFLITGATSGIGRAIAVALAPVADLILVGRRAERLETLARELEAVTNVTPLVLDVRDRGQVQKVLLPILEKHGLSGLINNAGLALGREPLQNGTWENWRTMMETNVMGLLAVTEVCLPYLIRAAPADVINIGSVAGRWVYPDGNVYCASKHAVNALTEGLRMDLLGQGVRVCHVAPGMVETEFSLVRFAGDSQVADAVYAGMEPLQAEDVAEAVAWVVSRPARVSIAELVLYPTDQASPRDVHRRKLTPPAVAAKGLTDD